MTLLTQIKRWLMQPELWRFVGFLSTVVGLLCYALSSSFNHLFGEWNLLKISLYSVFSIIICLAMFAKVWQHSTNLRFKAHLAFLVLTFTSVYSFFFDKAVNGKPDAYSLISCAAFAIVSLSLSRHIHCGFEVDLLYFFLGSLIIQLMKIKLLLAIVGGGFSYSLIILRSSLDAPSEIEYLGHQDHVIIQVDSQQVNTDSTAPITTSKEMDRIKGPWSPEEDEALQKLVETHRVRNWSLISKTIPGRSGKSCRLRWCNQLSLEVDHRPFTPEDDDLIVRAHARLGPKWATIARLLNGRRTDIAIKNHWYSILKRNAPPSPSLIPRSLSINLSKDPPASVPAVLIRISHSDPI